MDEHMKNIQEDWEQQQKDLGSDNSSPDITKITSRNDGQKSSDTDAANNMENAVNSSVNKLKDTMVNTAGPNSTGFAGGGAGYQWSVKYVGGKYVLSDSYNEAEFNTGKKKEKPAATTTPTPPKTNQGTDDKETVISKAPVKTTGTTAPSSNEPADTTGDPAPTQVAKVPGTQPTSTTSPGTSNPANSSSSSSSPASTPGKDGSSASNNPGKDTTPAPATPGVDPAPANLPPPAVRLVIQHPTDFSEEVFSSNTDKEDASTYDLEKFRIPEDTRVKIAVEVSEDVNPEDVTLVIVDEEGERAPVTASKMGNYRHMFRVPSDGNYSANVYVTDKDKPGNQQKKLMQVKIPVTKVDFESRTIDNQRGSKTSDGSSSSTMSSTSSSGSAGNFSHSSHGQSQQVDLSDLYSDPSAQSSENGSENAGSASAGSSGAATSGGSSENSGAAGSSASSSGSDSDQASAQSGSTAQGSSSGSSADGSSSYEGQTGTSGQGQDGTYQDAGTESTYSDAGNAAANTANGSSYSSSSDSSTSGEGSTDADGNNYGSAANGSDFSANGSGSDSSAGTSTEAGLDGSSASSDAGQTGEDNVNEVDVNGSSATNDSQGTEYASAQGVSSSSSSGKNGDSTAAGTANPQAALASEEEPEEDNFIMSVGLRSEAHKIYQSFDFADDPNQSSTTLPAGSEIIFNIVLGKQVDFDSVSIKMADGAEVFGGNLRTMGEAFAYSFKNESPDSFIQISGKAGNRSFTYLLKTPVAAKK
ncbi:MAG: hypothetical protein ACD_39C01503G0001, partial [uncultured bacterium]